MRFLTIDEFIKNMKKFFRKNTIYFFHFSTKCLVIFLLEYFFYKKYYFEFNQVLKCVLKIPKKMDFFFKI